MPSPPQFAHERLDVYQSAVAFIAWTGDLIDGPLSKCRLSAVNQLDRASTSISLNIAEGNGKRTPNDRCKYFDTACGSAYECAACLDALVARKALGPDEIGPGKAILHRIVEMLIKLGDRFRGE